MVIKIILVLRKKTLNLGHRGIRQEEFAGFAFNPCHWVHQYALCSQNMKYMYFDNFLIISTLPSQRNIPKIECLVKINLLFK